MKRKGRLAKNKIEPIDATPEELAKVIFAAADDKLKKPRVLFPDQAPVKKKEGET